MLCYDENQKVELIKLDMSDTYGGMTVLTVLEDI